MTVTAVIGAAFGDEGKGKVVDWSVDSDGNPASTIVVRYSGGAQAGHTVHYEGLRHVFHHFGSGSLRGAYTYLGPDFIANPMLFFKERAELERLEGEDTRLDVWSSAKTPITTWMDMLVNEMVEIERGASAHGSVGLGIHETRRRHLDFEEKLTLNSITHCSEEQLRKKLDWLRSEYYPERMRALGIDPSRHPERMEWFDSELIYDRWIFEAMEYGKSVASIDPGTVGRQFENIIFEGSQGLLLDEKSGFFPHVTHSRVGSAGLVKLAEEIGVEHFDHVHYCMRSYLTRHGAGPLPGEDPSISYADSTNVPHPWQGTMRFAEYDESSMDLIFDAIGSDLDVLEEHFELDDEDDKTDVTIVMSHLDQKFEYRSDFKESHLHEMLTERVGRDERISKFFWRGWGPLSQSLE